MKILQVNKFYYPRGGADKYFLNLTQSLRDAGDTVAVFAMHHPQNLPSPWAPYFVSRLSFNEGNWIDKLKTPGRILYSLEAKRKFTKLLHDFQPDIIHIHNIYHQLSPSILQAAAAQNIPIVMHLHDYKLICPDYQLLVSPRAYQACQQGHYYQCFLERCFQKSWIKSALVTLEMYLHHTWLKIYKKNISLFIAPSQFMKDTVVSFGWPAAKIKVLKNPFDQQLTEGHQYPEEDYLLYFGRLSPEKGIDTLIKAAALTKDKIKLAGVGAAENDLRKLAKQLKVPVDFLGFQIGQKLQEIILKAKAVIIPSVWAENMPLTLLEALSLGKIVIAANIGGLPEMIQNGQNGLLFPSGDIPALAKTIKSLDNLDKTKLKSAAIASTSELSPAKNAAAIKKIYQTILDKK